jgi:hypothetical protein
MVMIKSKKPKKRAHYPRPTPLGPVSHDRPIKELPNLPDEVWYKLYKNRGRRTYAQYLAEIKEGERQARLADRRNDRLTPALTERSDTEKAGNASRGIRALCDAALGNNATAVRLYMGHIVEMVDRGEAPPEWRTIVETEYPSMVKALDACFASRKPPAIRPALTDEQCKMVVEHSRPRTKGERDSLVYAAARKRATGINGAGKKSIDPELLAELEEIGLTTLMDQVAKWDRNRGVTFGAFAKLRVEGAMDNYLTRDRLKTVSYNEETIFDEHSAVARNRDKWKSESTDGA